MLLIIANWESGDKFRVTVHLNEGVTVSTTQGTPSYTLSWAATIGATTTTSTRVAQYNSAASTLTNANSTDLVFEYTIVAGDAPNLSSVAISAGSNSLSLNGATIRQKTTASGVVVGNADITDIPVLSGGTQSVLAGGADNTPPSVIGVTSTVASGQIINKTTSISLTYSFSKALNTSTLTAGDFAVTNGTISSVTPVGNTVATVLITQTTNVASGNVIVALTNNSYTDSSGISGAGHTYTVGAIDTLAPNAPVR